MDQDSLQVKTEDYQERENFNLNNLFDNYELDNLQETTNVTQAQQHSTNALYDNINVPYNYNHIDYIPEDIISGHYTYDPMSYMSQNANHHINEQNSNQNQSQCTFPSFNDLKINIPGFEIIIRPTFSLDVNLDNFDIQNLNPIQDHSSTYLDPSSIDYSLNQQNPLELNNSL